MTEQNKPTMQTWRRYAVLPPNDQTELISRLRKDAVYGGLDLSTATKYAKLARVLEKDETIVFASDPELLSILSSFLLTE